MVRRPSNNPDQVEGRQQKVTLTDLRAAKMCSAGARRFFKRHRLNWDTFIKSGIDDRLLLGTGDHMAKELVRVANERRRR